MCDPHVERINGIVQVAIPYKEYAEMFDDRIKIDVTDSPDQLRFKLDNFSKIMEDHKAYVELLWEDHKNSQLPEGKHIRYGDFYKGLDTSHDASRKIFPASILRDNPVKHDNHWLILKVAEEFVVQPWGLGDYVQHRIVEIRNAVVLDEPEEIEGFPFKDVYQLELVPDDTYYGGPPRVSYEKRKAIVEYCTNDDIKIFYSWNFDKVNMTSVPSTHSYHSPFYASVLFEKSSDAMLCKLKF